MIPIYFTSMKQFLEKTGTADIYVYMTADSNPDNAMTPGKTKNAPPKLQKVSLHKFHVYMTAQISERSYAVWHYSQINGYTSLKDPRPNPQIRQSLDSQRALFNELVKEIENGYPLYPATDEGTQAVEAAPRNIMRGLVGEPTDGINGQLDIPLDVVLKNLEAKAAKEAESRKAQEEAAQQAAARSEKETEETSDESSEETEEAEAAPEAVAN